ncbi:MAG: hypothetical protein WC548_00425 [Candidatus Pacearchaeota archaeon]
MKNRNVGILIVGISVVIIAIIFLFNSGLQEIVSQTCDHGSTCSMYSTISMQTKLSLAIAGLVFIIGVFLIFSKESEKIIFRTRKVIEKRKPINLDGLDKNEKEVVKILQTENGAMFQSALMEKLGIGKVGMTRLLDKLEAKQIIERKRRGMNNIIVLR